MEFSVTGTNVQITKSDLLRLLRDAGALPAEIREKEVEVRSMKFVKSENGQRDLFIEIKPVK